MGVAYAHFGEIYRAIDCYEQALKIDRESGDKRGEGLDLGNLGVAFYKLAAQYSQTDYKSLSNKKSFDNNPLQRAIYYLNQAFEISKEIGDKIQEGDCRCNVGEVYLEMCVAESSNKWLQQAIEYHHKALEIHEETYSTRVIPDYKNLGISYLFACTANEAIRYFQSSIVKSEKVLAYSQLYEVLYCKVFSELALICISNIHEHDRFDDVIKSYRRAISLNSYTGVLRAQIHEVERLQKILSMTSKSDAVTTLLNEVLARLYKEL